jgi:hypothetical protein
MPQLYAYQASGSFVEFHGACTAALGLFLLASSLFEFPGYALLLSPEQVQGMASA